MEVSVLVLYVKYLKKYCFKKGRGDLSNKGFENYGKWKL